MQSLDTWTLTRRQAAVVADVTEAQIQNWMAKNNLFSGENIERGKGHSVPYTLSRLMMIAAIGRLTKAGLEASKAVEAVRSYSILGAMFNGTGPFDYSPGVFTWCWNGERWVGMDKAHAEIKIKLSIWALFDEVFPRLCEEIRGNRGNRSSEDVEKMITKYIAFIEERRETFWGSDT